MGRILTTHAGSLVRPQALLDFLAKIERGEPVDEAAYADTSRMPSRTSCGGRRRWASTSSTTARSKLEALAESAHLATKQLATAPTAAV